MNKNNKARLNIILPLAGAMLWDSSALAFDAESIIKRYQDAAAEQGQSFTYGTVRQNGADGITVTNPVWTIPSVTPIKGSSLVLSGVTEQPNGELNIARLETDSIVSGSAHITVLFDNALIENLRLPAVNETDPIKKLAWYTRFATGAGKVMLNGKEVASMEDGEIIMSPLKDAAPIKMSSEINGIRFDTTSIPDAKFQKALGDLGYAGQFSGKIAMKIDWDMIGGIMDIGQYDIVLDDVGTLSMPFSIGGYSIKDFAALQEIAKEMEGKSPEEQEKASLEMVKNMYPLKFSLSFKDDSLTERLLKMASVQMNQPAEQIVAGAPIMMSLAMGQLQMPEFTAMASDAVGKFLQSRGTIRVVSTPKQPFDFKKVEAASSNPSALVDLLGIKVEAE